jgi:hypothetical protein
MGERIGGGKVEGTNEGNRWVGKRDNIGPGYILAGRWLVVGSEEDLVTKDDATVSWVNPKKKMFQCLSNVSN